jgi:hypothetical protein
MRGGHGSCTHRQVADEFNNDPEELSFYIYIL